MGRIRNPNVKTAAERAAAEVYELVRAAAESAARQAVQDAIQEQLGVWVDDVSIEDKVTRAEAARRFGTTPQTIIRLEDKGLVKKNKVAGRVYVSLSEVGAALRLRYEPAT